MKIYTDYKAVTHRMKMLQVRILELENIPEVTVRMHFARLNKGKKHEYGCFKVYESETNKKLYAIIKRPKLSETSPQSE